MTKRRKKILLIYPRQGLAQTTDWQCPVQDISHLLMGAHVANRIWKRLTKQERLSPLREGANKTAGIRLHGWQ